MPSTRVWVKQGLDSHRSAQVLLVPLGNIPPHVYAKYCEILRRFRCVNAQQQQCSAVWGIVSIKWTNLCKVLSRWMEILRLHRNVFGRNACR